MGYRDKPVYLLRKVAFRIIDFIAQFEEELVKIWLKPRFVLNSNYVITLDRIAEGERGIEVIKAILNHPNIQEQIEEWKELKIVDESFKLEEVLQNQELNLDYQFLPIDTKYFKDIENQIISLFDKLDNEIDGWSIKSENFQALDTILPRESSDYLY